MNVAATTTNLFYVSTKASLGPNKTKVRMKPNYELKVVTSFYFAASFIRNSRELLFRLNETIKVQLLAE